MPFTRTLRIRSFRWTLQLLKLSVSNVFFLSRADHSWDIEMFRHLFFSGYIFLGRCLRCFETIPGPVHGGGGQAKFPSGDLGFSASLSPLLLLGVWLDPES